MPVKLGAGNPTPDVFMVWALGQSIAAHWLEPLDAMMGNLALTDLTWWDDADVFGSARGFQVGPDGQNYVLAITAEAETLFVDQPMLQAKGLAVPTTMDQLLAAAKALKTPDVRRHRHARQGQRRCRPLAGRRLRLHLWRRDHDAARRGGAEPAGSRGGDRHVRAIAARDRAGRRQQLSLDGVPGRLHVGRRGDGLRLVELRHRHRQSEQEPGGGKAVYGILPNAGHGPAKPNMWHWTAGINSRSANKDAAWLFLSWATSKPTCLLLAAAGLATPRASAWQSDAFRKRFGAQAADAALANLKAADASLMKATWFHPKAPQILDPFGIAINETVTGAKTAQAALDDAAKKIHAAIG